MIKIVYIKVPLQSLKKKQKTNKVSLSSAYNTTKY